MKCESIREAMDGYLDGSLTPLEMEAVEAHVEQCEACRAALERRRELLEQLAQLDDGVKAPEGLLEGAMARIRQQRSPKRKTGWWIAGGIAAALCVTAGLAGLAIGGTGMKSAAPQAPPFAYEYASGAAMDVVVDMAAEGAYDMPADAEKMGSWTVEAPAEAPESMPDTGAVETMTQKSAMAEAQDTAQYGLKIIRDASRRRTTMRTWSSCGRWWRNSAGLSRRATRVAARPTTSATVATAGAWSCSRACRRGRWTIFWSWPSRWAS